MEHLRQGHDVRFVDGGVCGVCDGHGQVSSQGAALDTPGGRWIRCPRCQGAGYTSEAPNAHRRKAAGPGPTVTNATQSESRAEQEARWAEANRRREEEARRAKERTDREREANEARRREENRRAAEEARRRAEEARQPTVGSVRTQNNDWNPTSSHIPCPTCRGAGRVPTKFHNTLGLPLDPSPEEIGSAFRRKAMQYHPDRNNAPDAGERMKEINEARRLLARSAEIRAGQECPQCHGRRTVVGTGAQADAGVQAGAGSERDRQETDRRTQANAQEERRREHRETPAKRTSSGARGRWALFGLLFIALAGGGGYYWEASQQTQLPLVPIQTPRCEDPTHVVSESGDSCIPPTPTPTPATASTPAAASVHAPAPPHVLVPNPGHEQLAIYWIAPTTGLIATRYILELDAIADMAGPVEYNVTGTSYTLTGLTNEMQYSVRVRAYHRGCNCYGDWSNRVYGTPRNYTPTPTADLTATATPTPAPYEREDSTGRLSSGDDLIVAVFESITDAQRNVSPEGVRASGSITAGDTAYMASGATPRKTYADGTLYISNQQHGTNAALITAAIEARAIGDDICGKATARNQRSGQSVSILLAPASEETTQGDKKYYQGMLYVTDSSTANTVSFTCDDYYTSGVNAPQMLLAHYGEKITITVGGVAGTIEIAVCSRLLGRAQTSSGRC